MTALFIVVTLFSVAKALLMARVCSFPSGGIQVLALPAPTLVSSGEHAHFAHAYSEWYLLRLLPLSQYVLRRDVVKGAKKGWRRRARAELRYTWHQSGFQGKRRASSLHLCPFINQERPKLTALSVYLIYARYPSHREDTTVQSCLHVLTHAPCDFRWLGTTKPFLFQHRCDRVQGGPCYAWAHHGDTAMELVT